MLNFDIVFIIDLAIASGVSMIHVIASMTVWAFPLFCSMIASLSHVESAKIKERLFPVLA